MDVGSYNLLFAGNTVLIEVLSLPAQHAACAAVAELWNIPSSLTPSSHLPLEWRARRFFQTIPLFLGIPLLAAMPRHMTTTV